MQEIVDQGLDIGKTTVLEELNEGPVPALISTFFSNPSFREEEGFEQMLQKAKRDYPDANKEELMKISTLLYMQDKWFKGAPLLHSAQTYQDFKKSVIVSKRAVDEALLNHKSVLVVTSAQVVYTLYQMYVPDEELKLPLNCAYSVLECDNQGKWALARKCYVGYLKKELHTLN